MSPHRLVHPRLWPLYVASALVLAAFAFSAWAIRDRTIVINRLLFEQCVANESQDTVIVAQLEAAKQRVKASLPPGNPLRQEQLLILEDGIRTLEPAGEEDCVR
jgi:hypothetical protein